MNGFLIKFRIYIPVPPRHNIQSIKNGRHKRSSLQRPCIVICLEALASIFFANFSADSANGKFVPDGWVEHDKEREELQTSRHHVKDKYPLGKYSKMSKILCRPYHRKSWTDIVKGSSNGRKVGNEILFL